ncbi:hypothetical protein EV1_002786 [Malus domestica]
MDYDYRSRSGQIPNYLPATSSAPSSHPMYRPPSSSFMNPQVGQQSHVVVLPPYEDSAGRPLPRHISTAHPPFTYHTHAFLHWTYDLANLTLSIAFISPHYQDC